MFSASSNLVGSEGVEVPPPPRSSSPIAWNLNSCFTKIRNNKTPLRLVPELEHKDAAVPGIE